MTIHAKRPASPLDRRRAGILLHPTSLPGSGPTGELGDHAYRFVDFLIHAKLSVWQTLPLGPTHGDLSPYQCQSVHAGSLEMISWDQVRQAGWLTASEHHIDHHKNTGQLQALLEESYRGFIERAGVGDRQQYEQFKREQQYWLDDYALYDAMRREQQGKPWWEWPQPLRDRHDHALQQARDRLGHDIEVTRYGQFIFFRQWLSIKRYANERGILIFGDMPIFVAHDSADVWAHRSQFVLDERGHTRVVAGVPPDYFSETGQRWGNPHYDWERMQQDGFAWWLARLRTQLSLFDLVRIDHFRGFEAYWEIPANSKTAVHGRWVKAPGHELFKAMHETFDPLPLVAEDLGIITDEVTALRKAYNLPGMKVLQFAFEGGGNNPYLPHNHEPNSVVYTGTHDNDTTVGWFYSLPDQVRHHVQEYLGFPQEDAPWPLIRSAFASVSRLAILPMQDVLMLGSDHRMNVPGITEKNWRWRFSWEQIPHYLSERLSYMVNIYGRGEEKAS